jgi:hypothetical protein
VGVVSGYEGGGLTLRVANKQIAAVSHGDYQPFVVVLHVLGLPMSSFLDGTRAGTRPPETMRFGVYRLLVLRPSHIRWRTSARANQQATATRG